MIKPGQKLSEGDWCKNISKKQAKELMQIDHTGFPEGYERLIATNGVKFNGDWNGLFRIDHSSKLITEYTFPDFKKLCENTFGA